MQIKKIKGSNTKPCGTPAKTGDHQHYSLMSGLKKVLQQFQRHACYTNTFHFVDEAFMPCSIKGYSNKYLCHMFAGGWGELQLKAIESYNSFCSILQIRPSCHTLSKAIDILRNILLTYLHWDGGWCSGELSKDA